MVTPIKYYKSDPNGLGRGAGAYYHRGNGYFSKFSRKRDENKLSTNWQTHKIGLPGGTRYPHITDGNIRKYWQDNPAWFGRKAKK